ncbi:hypothetical protein AM593_09323, partial [Mytilus galloprovincialis]
MKSQATSTNSKIQTLDKDMTSTEEDFKREGDNGLNTTTTVIILEMTKLYELKQREIGGYLVKIDDSSENSWILEQIKISGTKTHVWLGSTDVVNGDWRWIYDHTQLSYKNFISGSPLPT